MTLLEAAQAENTRHAAVLYALGGISVIPLVGKKCPISWREYQRKAAQPNTVARWASQGWLQNVGIVCGQVSRLVVIDLDGLSAVALFEKQFPELLDTFTVLTGSGTGRHFYLAPVHMPPTTRVMGLPEGNIELRAKGCYVVAPPSIHPETGAAYCVERAMPVKQVQDLRAVQNWIMRLLRAKRPTKRLPTPKRGGPVRSWHPMNARLIQHIGRELLSKGYEVKGAFLFGQCLFPERHKNGDAHASFGFDMQRGRAHCFACGFIPTIDVCRRLGIDVNQYGGLWEK